MLYPEKTDAPDLQGIDGMLPEIVHNRTDAIERQPNYQLDMREHGGYNAHAVIKQRIIMFAQPAAPATVNGKQQRG